MISGLRLPLLLALMGALGCSLAPTRVVENRSVEFDQVVEKTRHPIVMTEDTVVLDARSSFEHGLSHVQYSLSLPATGGATLPRDPEKAAKKLALMGLDPSRPVVVVGSGDGGSGEEGKLAWELLRLGFSDVQVAAVQLFRSRWTNQQTPQPQNVSPWPPGVRNSLDLTAKECANLVVHPKEWQEKRVWLVDVRAPSEHLRNAAINLEWRDFYTSDGRPDTKLHLKLRAFKIRPEDRLVLISAKGFLSASAAYSLVALGYTQVQNCSAGWEEILQAAARDSDLLGSAKK